jgi:hypothetical protein
MQRAGTALPERRQLQRLGPLAQCGMIRHGEVKPEQPDDGADQPSVCRSARPNTYLIVSAVVIARDE